MGEPHDNPNRLAKEKEKKRGGRHAGRYAGRYAGRSQKNKQHQDKKRVTIILRTGTPVFAASVHII